MAPTGNELPPGCCFVVMSKNCVLSEALGLWSSLAFYIVVFVSTVAHSASQTSDDDAASPSLIRPALEYPTTSDSDEYSIPYICGGAMTVGIRITLKPQMQARHTPTTLKLANFGFKNGGDTHLSNIDTRYLSKSPLNRLKIALKPLANKPSHPVQIGSSITPKQFIDVVLTPHRWFH